MTSAVMTNESYSGPTAFRHLRKPELSPPVPVPASIKRKLEYYGSGADEPFEVTAPEIIIKLAETEGRDPSAYADFISDLSAYQVTCPNMFLCERVSDGKLVTEFSPKGPAASRIRELARELAGEILSAGKPIHAKIDPQALNDYIDDYASSHLAGPFPSIVDVTGRTPLLILPDMSFTGHQLFRAFAGVYCDYTPSLKLSKLDFLEFSVRHEMGHKKMEDILLNNRVNEFLPGIDLKIDSRSISSRNIVESAADAYGILKFIQRTGDAEFPRQVSVMRTLSAFSPCYREFETDFSLCMGGSGRRRVVSEYYTAPVINRAIEQGLAMHKSGRLQSMDEKELTGLALSIAREFKLSESALLELSALATTINFNNRPEPEFNTRDVPKPKYALSPYAVEEGLKAVLQSNAFEPKGGDAIEKVFGTGDSIFHKDHVQLSDELRQVASEYGNAIRYLESHGLRPRTEQYHEQLCQDLLATLGLPINQTPNMTLAREVNDCRASYAKLSVLWHRSYNCVGLDRLMKEADPDTAFNNHRKYSRYTDQGEDPLYAVLNWFGDIKSPSVNHS